MAELLLEILSEKMGEYELVNECMGTCEVASKAVSD